MRTLYTIVFLLLLPLFVLRLFWRARKAPAYALRIGERFARVPARPDSAPLLWVHAVSVGEVIAATPMIRRLQQEHPQYAVCVTTTTPTGSDRVRAAFGNTVLHYYMPYDLPFLQRLFINAIRPAVLVVMETELWPNVIALCHDKKIPVIVANARMSTSSARGYRRLAALTRPMLQQLSLIAAQSRADAQRFVYLGADRSKVRVTGSIKFDVRIDDVVRQRKSALLAQLQCQQRKVVVFASTHPGEDEQILPVIRRLHQQHAEFLAIVVPRHPERFDVVARLAQQLHMPLVRLSTGERCEASTSLVLGDTMGDMLAIYGLAQVAFVGGSLIARGGHNFLEAAAWGLPVLSGASVYNFQDIARLLLRQGGLRLLHDHVELESLLQDWLAGQADLAAMGTSALAVLESNRGALQKLLDAVEEVADIRQ